jgi:ferredoxin
MITEEHEPFSDTVEEAAPVEACTKCTACNTVCPVARSTDIFRGPKFLGPESERYRDPQEPTVTAGLDLCSGCKLCEVACPSQVSIQEYIRRAQNKGANEKGRTLRDWVLGHTRLLGEFGSRTAPLANFGEVTFTKFFAHASDGNEDGNNDGDHQDGDHEGGHSKPVAITMTGPKSPVRAEPGAFHGNHFTVTWKASL